MSHLEVSHVLLEALDAAVLAPLSSLGSAQNLQSYLECTCELSPTKTFVKFTFKPSVDLTLIGALLRQYLEYLVIQ